MTTPSGRLARLLAIGSLLIVGWPRSAAAIDDPAIETRFLTGLRERRLFSLAEAYCQRRLADRQLAGELRGTLTIEWIRTLGDHARNVAKDQRQAVWQRADDLATAFLNEYRNHPQVLLVKTQQALTRLMQGESARLESEMAADRDAALAAARDILRLATQLLETVATEINATIPQRRQASLPPEALTPSELLALFHNVRFYRARASLNQALSYDEGSSDWIAALTLAVEQLAGLLKEIGPDDPLGREIRLETTICRRLLKDPELTTEIWQSLDAPGVSPQLRMLARAEHARWHLAAGRLQPSLQVLAAGRELEGQTSPELDLAHVETSMALWQAASTAKQDAEAQKWQEQSLKAVERIEQIHGPYWSRRAELLLVRPGTQRGSGAEILRRTADNFFRKGELDEALVTYDKAALAARDTKDLPAAFELAYKAALVEQQRSRHVEAAARFRQLAVASRLHPQAANAHLLAIANEAQAGRGDPARGSQYQELLAEHLTTWPQSSTANAAQLWLGGLREREKAWELALQHYRSVDANSEHFQNALLGADRCWTAWLTARQEAGERVESAADEAATWLEQVYLGADQILPDMWTATQRLACLAAARLRLAWMTDQYSRVEQPLRRALDGAPPPDSDWKSLAAVWLVVAVAGQPTRLEDARQLLDQAPVVSADVWFAMVQRLASIPGIESEKRRTEVFRFVLSALERLAASNVKLTEEMSRQVELLRGNAWAAAGDYSAAVQCLSQLGTRWPRDGKIQAALGDILLSSPDPADWRRALDQWRIVAAQSEPRTRLWFQAKYSTALAQCQLGEKPQAAKLIRYLQATENLADSGFERLLSDLLKRCEQP